MRRFMAGQDALIKKIAEELDRTPGHVSLEVMSANAEKVAAACGQKFFEKLEGATGLSFASEARTLIMAGIVMYWNRVTVQSKIREQKLQTRQRTQAKGVADQAQSLSDAIRSHVFCQDYWNGERGGLLHQLFVLSERMRRFSERPRRRRLGSEYEDALTRTLGEAYKLAGGKVMISWDHRERSRVGGPFARYLMLIWEVLPSEHRHAAAQSFARRAKEILPTLKAKPDTFRL
jgi:hypothetical protein